MDLIQLKPLHQQTLPASLPPKFGTSSVSPSPCGNAGAPRELWGAEQGWLFGVFIPPQPPVFGVLGPSLPARVLPAQLELEFSWSPILRGSGTPRSRGAAPHPCPVCATCPAGPGSLGRWIWGSPKPPHPWNAAASPPPLVLLEHRIPSLGIRDGRGGKGPFQQGTPGTSRTSVPGGVCAPPGSLQDVVPKGCAGRMARWQPGNSAAPWLSLLSLPRE